VADAASTNFALKGTAGQTGIGSGSSTNFVLLHGYWQDFGRQTCCNGDGIRGNVDMLIGPGGPIDVSDLTYLVAYLFTGGPEPPCIEEGNVDGLDGSAGPIDVSDLTFLVVYLFTGGPPAGDEFATPPIRCPSHDSSVLDCRRIYVTRSKTKKNTPSGINTGDACEPRTS